MLQTEINDFCPAFCAAGHVGKSLQSCDGSFSMGILATQRLLCMSVA
jgi:hypothetical protein